MQQEGWVRCIWYIYIFLLYGMIELSRVVYFFVVYFRVSSSLTLEQFVDYKSSFLTPITGSHGYFCPRVSAIVNCDSLYSTVSVSNLAVSILHWVLPFLINSGRVVDLSVCSALVRIELETEAPYMHYWKSHHYCIWCPWTLYTLVTLCSIFFLHILFLISVHPNTSDHSLSKSNDTLFFF